MAIPGSNPSPKKLYPGSTDEESKQYYDMSLNDTQIYGGFSVGPEPGEGDGGGEEIVQPPMVNIQNIQRTVISNVNSTMTDFIQRDIDPVIGGDF